MSGIYIHIPFCKQACFYCNFHFSTSLRLKNEMITAICNEIKLREEYLQDKYLTSIYFGGGSPSLLDESDLDKIFITLSRHFSWDSQTEITLEANPDDIDTKKLSIFKKWGINRLSIGVQSFFDIDLKWMNRAHDAMDATKCIQLSQDSGFENITIDLIYGSPTTTTEMWQENILRTLNFKIPHLSSYCLTVEEKTALHYQVKTKATPAPNPELATEQFNILIDTLTLHGFDHYEISNFGLPGQHAIHNTNYWKGVSYLGIGPSAHSFNGTSRSWNIANNKKYIDSILLDILPHETETLSVSSRYNEFVMTGLRTMWGVNDQKIQNFGVEYLTYFMSLIQHEIQKGHVIKNNGNYSLSKEGKHFADRIAMNLFYVD